MQASFLDFTLFEDDPKLFSEYVLMDTKTRKVYTDKFRMFVINLRKAREAAQEERRCGLEAREDALNYERAMQRKMVEVTQKCDELTQERDEVIDGCRQAINSVEV